MIQILLSVIARLLSGLRIPYNEHDGQTKTGKRTCAMYEALHDLEESFHATERGEYVEELQDEWETEHNQNVDLHTITQVDFTFWQHIVCCEKPDHGDPEIDRKHEAPHTRQKEGRVLHHVHAGVCVHSLKSPTPHVSGADWLGDHCTQIL